MINQYFKISILITALLVLFAGCSGSSNPVSVENAKDKGNDLPVIGLTEAKAGSDAIGMMGSYELKISGDKQTAELVSTRMSDLGQSYLINGKSFFAMTPCSNCLAIKSIALTSEGFIYLKLRIRHPFNPGDPLKPPSGLNRLDLDIFDVALLVRPLDVIPQNFTLSDLSAYTGYIVNASGYSRELANVLDDNAAIPYVLVVDDNASGQNTYNKFEMGAESEFDLMVDVNEVTNFNLFLTMGYGASATRPMRLTPQYFNPEFNRKSAWKVSVAPPNGENPPDLSNTWNETDSTTLHKVTVRVWDWQIGANVDPNLVNPTDVYASSEVSKVSLEIPGMRNAILEVTTPASGTGAPNDPLLYELSLANENLLGEGEYTGIVKVSDERIPGEVTIGGETDTLGDSIDGIRLEWVNIPEFATYQSFTATVMGVSPFVLEKPNGGEVWPVDSEQTIRWSGADTIPFVKLEYSKDDFVADIHEIIPSTENDQEFLWRIPNDQSDSVKIRISGDGFPGMTDTSDDYFVITSGLPEMIVYAADGPASGRQIYSIDPEGVGPPKQWTSSSAAFNECAKLSPSGQYIIYTAADLSTSQLRIIDVTTGVETNINPPGLETVYGDFSHDGTRIVGACGPIWWDVKEVYTFDYTGNDPQKLTTGADAWAPEFSFDDSQIYYQNFTDSQVYILDVASGISTQYTNNGTWNDDPHGDPSGTYITWATMYGNGCRWVYISPLTGWNPPTYLINFDDCVRSPCFNPDGTKIVVDHGSYDGSEIAIYDIGAGTWHNITSNAWGDYMADWGYMVPY